MRRSTLPTRRFDRSASGAPGGGSGPGGMLPSMCADTRTPLARVARGPHGPEGSEEVPEASDPEPATTSAYVERSTVTKPTAEGVTSPNV